MTPDILGQPNVPGWHRNLAFSWYDVMVKFALRNPQMQRARRVRVYILVAKQSRGEITN